MSTVRRRVTHYVLIALALLVGSIMPAAGMMAAPRSITPQDGAIFERYYFSYYSDDTYSTRVGRARTDCDGNYYWLWGYETEYEVVTPVECPL
jgi:hypothetical protein